MEENALTPIEVIESKIYLIRGKKVMFDRDLAVLYGVSTKVLNQAVKRNQERFPEDFMLELSLSEASNLKSQIVTSSFTTHEKYPTSQFVTLDIEHGGRRKPMMAFTELGVAMLSSVLKSKRAIFVNIQIMRTFTKLREMLANHEDLRLKLEALESRYDGQFKIVFDALRQLISTDEEVKPEIGFKDV